LGGLFQKSIQEGNVRAQGVKMEGEEVNFHASSISAIYKLSLVIG